MLSNDEFEFFRRHGYLVLSEAFTPEEVRYYRQLYEHDRSVNNYNWSAGLDLMRGGHMIRTQSSTHDPLVTTPQLEPCIRHHRILSAVEHLMGGPICFSEISLRYMGPYTIDGPKKEIYHEWHRDRPHWLEHPLRMEHIQAMILLSDVTEHTHCFSISPESVDEPILADHDAQLAHRGCTNVHGPTGTVVLFNSSVLHTATRRTSEAERYSIQIYYGLRSRPYMSDYTTVPAALWRDHPDPEIRAFYGNFNQKTRDLAKAFDGAMPEDEAHDRRNP